MYIQGGDGRKDPVQNLAPEQPDMVRILKKGALSGHLRMILFHFAAWEGRHDPGTQKGPEERKEA